MTSPAATEAVRVGSIAIGGGAPLVLIGGPCAIEDEKHALMTAERLAKIASDRRVSFIYKSSYDKANRFSINSYRGPGLREGLRILKKVRDTLGLPVLSDVHQVDEVAPASEVLDVREVGRVGGDGLLVVVGGQDRDDAGDGVGALGGASGSAEPVVQQHAVVEIREPPQRRTTSASVVEFG